MPGFKNIHYLLEHSKSGFIFASGDHPEGSNQISGLPQINGFAKVMNLYSILSKLGKESRFKTMESINYETKQL